MKAQNIIDTAKWSGVPFSHVSSHSMITSVSNLLSLWLSDKVLSPKSTSFTQQKHEHCQQTWHLQGDFRNVVFQLPVVSTNAFENCPGLWLPFDYKYKSFMKAFARWNMLFVLVWVCLQAMVVHVWLTVLVSYFLWIESCGVFIFAFVLSSTIIAKPHGMILTLLKPVSLISVYYPLA